MAQLMGRSVMAVVEALSRRQMMPVHHFLVDEHNQPRITSDLKLWQRGLDCITARLTMRFGCETRLPWSPPRTKTSNTTTPKSHENPNSSSVKGGNEGSLGGGFLVKNLGLVLFYATHSRQPQCWVNLQTLPLQVLEATDIGNRRIAAAAATHSHTLTSLGSFYGESL